MATSRTSWLRTRCLQQLLALLPGVLSLPGKDPAHVHSLSPERYEVPVVRQVQEAGVVLVLGEITRQSARRAGHMIREVTGSDGGSQQAAHPDAVGEGEEGRSL